MYDITKINEAVPPLSIVNFLCSHLQTTYEKQGNQWEIKGQGGLYVDESGRIAKPGEGKKSGGVGIVSAVTYAKTGQWKTTGHIFAECLKEASEIAGVSEDPDTYNAPASSAKPAINYNEPSVIYSYYDEDGKEVFQNCRYEWFDKNGIRQKTFRQRHKKGDSWVYNLHGIKKVPYNLLEAMKEPDTLADCEGEKDVETLREKGMTGINIKHSTKEDWINYADIAKDKTILVMEDNDKAGRDSAQKRARFWYKHAKNVKIVSFNQMPEKSDLTDWFEADTTRDIFDFQAYINTFQYYHPLRDIIVDFFHIPTKRKPIITINGQHIVSEGEIAGYVAGIGVGKSHWMEIMASLSISPTCEPLSGIEINLNPGDKVIMFDTERTIDDCYYGLQRMWRRVGQKPSLLSDDKRQFHNFTMATTSHLPHEERRERVLEGFETPGAKLIYLDGALDFVINPNDIEQCVGFARWLHQMANKYKVAVFYSLHGNRGDVSGKGKGWLGAELQHKSSAFLRLARHEQNPEIRILTSDFDNVKVRSGKDTGINVAMKWNDDLNAFRCLDFIEGPITDKATPEEATQWVFIAMQKKYVTKKEFLTEYEKIMGCNHRTAYRHWDEIQEYLNRISLEGKIVYSYKSQKDL